jgi:DNA-binding transcriptional MerR regulator/mannose-6-phosphate isomerase-like protein (cupin superfamily)
MATQPVETPLETPLETYPVVGEALKIGAVARRLGISASMLRAWEKVGVVRPSRTGSSYRIYTQEDVRALRRAVYLRRSVGLNAPAIVNQLRQEGLLNHHGARASGNQPSVGPVLRKLRLERGESLATVARAADVSIGFLSNLERSQTSVSIGAMRKLAQHYGLNILDFFSPAEAKRPLIRASERRILQGGEGVQMELLATGKIIMEPHLFRVAPGAGSGEFYSHEGEEFLYLTRGRLVILLEDREFRLSAGDSFYFESKIPHRWFNPGKKETVILWINTPPTF